MNKNSRIELISLESHGDLVVLENNNLGLPFNIYRIFYIFGVKEKTVRGCHANRNSKFLLIAVHGSVKVRVRTLDKDEMYILDDPKKGLYLDSCIWKEMLDFSKDCVLMVASDLPFDNEEYIDDYSQYLEEIK